MSELINLLRKNGNETPENIAKILNKSLEDVKNEINELEQKVVGLVGALKSEKEKNSENSNKVIESQKLSKIEDHVKNMIKVLDDFEGAN